jgi:hypothetical protein
VDRPHDVRPRDGQQVVVASNVAGVVAEPLAAEVVLGQAEALDLSAGGSVQDQDPPLQQRP